MGEEIRAGITTSEPDTVQAAMKDYMASLRYAGMIQQAMLPPPALMNSLFSRWFVLYLPRDYVSGDFYYVYRGKNFFCISAGDCTGHGVPGALLSIMGVNFLNEIFQCQPAPRANRVLNLMREKVMSTLHQTGRRGETMDSIDLSLCIFNYDSGEMQFSGANRPLFIVRKGEMREIRPDKIPIGLAPLREESFNNTIVEFDEDDTFYLFSDGFADQFGGEENKKFKYKQFRNLLIEVANLPAEKQKSIVESTFFDWKGRTQQIDDVTVLGFKPRIQI
jgi:serine phosphatase RsbU (regulator of sigma subunit)